ncbi:hypothetical protein BJF78_12165 [Pseudonocardia sp. CNS-139]|nr:hypothetical protein BJF78_12165 [Pseudonocardia sp. CNS-139]
MGANTEERTNIMRRIVIWTVAAAVVGTTLAGCLPGAEAEAPAPAATSQDPAAPADPSATKDPDATYDGPVTKEDDEVK